jgi:hypothetical protein
VRRHEALDLDRFSLKLLGALGKALIFLVELEHPDPLSGKARSRQ